MAGYQPRHDTDPVWFNGTQINNLSIASQQTGVLVTAIHGWDERPDVRDVRELRSGQDGEYADNLYLGGRTITIEGEVYGSTWANLQSRKRTLGATFIPTSDEVLLKVPDPATASPTTSYSTTGMTGYERVSCRVIEAIQFGDTLDPCCQTFQVVLRASDPRVYSDTQTDTDSGTAGSAARTVSPDSAGTYDTPITVEVTGPASSGFTVNAPTSGIVLDTTDLALAAGETVTFDTQERTVTVGAALGRSRRLVHSVIAQWMLDETAGTTADNAQGTAAYDGTYTGGYTLNQSGPFTNIESVAFNGTTGYVTVPYNAALVPTESTFECWVKFDTVAADQTIADFFNSANNTGWYLSLASTGRLVVTCHDGVDGDTLLTSCYPAAGTWVHVVVTYSTVEDVARAYVNGLPVGSLYLPNMTVATTGAIQLGRAETSQYLDGNLSACTLFSGILSAIEIQELYEGAGELAELNGYRFLDSEATRWGELGTAASTFTLSGSGLSTGSKLRVSYRDARL
jgi:hypothetical protein